MAPIPFYSGIDSVSSFLSGDFHADKYKFNFAAKSENGTEMSLNNTRSPSGAITSELQFTRKCSCDRTGLNYTLAGSVDLAGKISTTATFNNLADGLTLELNNRFNADTTKLADQVMSGTLKYKAQQLALLGKLERTRLGKTTATASAVTAYENFRFGGEVVFSNTPGEDGKPSTNKTTYALATVYETDCGSQFAVRSTECFNKLNFGFTHKVSDAFTAGAELTHTLNADKDPYTFSVGTRYTIDNDSTFKSKLSSSGVLGLAYTTKMSDKLKVGISSECNVVDMSKGVTIGAAFNYQ